VTRKTDEVKSNLKSKMEKRNEGSKEDNGKRGKIRRNRSNLARKKERETRRIKGR